MKSPLVLKLLMILITLAGCSTPKRAVVSNPLNLSIADKIMIHQTSGAEAEQILGPAKVKIPEDSSNEVWLFCPEERCSQGRITLGLNTSTHLVTSVAWNVRSGDQEQNLQSALAHFHEATFKRKRYLNDYIDYFFESESYSDSNLGITIAYDSRKKIVTAIYRNDPKNPSTIARTAKIPVVTEIPDRDTASSP